MCGRHVIKKAKNFRRGATKGGSSKLIASRGSVCVTIWRFFLCDDRLNHRVSKIFRVSSYAWARSRWNLDWTHSSLITITATTSETRVWAVAVEGEESEWKYLLSITLSSHCLRAVSMQKINIFMFYLSRRCWFVVITWQSRSDNQVI